MLWLISIILLVIIEMAVIILMNSSGKPKQGMFIKGKDKTKPVLLFLHGGPAMPQNWFHQKYPSGIEDEFVVCCWEQRGAGLSYDEDIVEAVSSEQLVLDGIELSKYLQQRFRKEKIYLMGHSWGSTIGIQIAAQAPELYHAYIGMGQISNFKEMELATYNYCLAHYQQTGSKKMVDKLLKNPIDLQNPPGNGWETIHDSVTGQAGVATTRDMKSEITGMFFPSFFAEEYTVTEKINLWKSFFSKHTRGMKAKLFSIDYSAYLTEFKLPIYFFSGRYDYATAYPVSADYFNKLNAPIKGFYTFEESAHSPLFEEPKKTMKILCSDVLARKNDLADSKNHTDERISK